MDVERTFNMVWAAVLSGNRDAARSIFTKLTEPGFEKLMKLARSHAHKALIVFGAVSYAAGCLPAQNQWPEAHAGRGLNRSAGR